MRTACFLFLSVALMSGCAPVFTAGADRGVERPEPRDSGTEGKPVGAAAGSPVPKDPQRSSGARLSEGTMTAETPRTGDGAMVEDAEVPSGSGTASADGHREEPSSESTSPDDGADVAAGKSPSGSDTSAGGERPGSPFPDGADAEAPSVSDPPTADGHQGGSSSESAGDGDEGNAEAAGAPSEADTLSVDGRQEGVSLESTPAGDGEATSGSAGGEQPGSPLPEDAGTEGSRGSGEPISMSLIGLGMECELRDGQIAVVGTAENGVAESMGLQDGDVITSINGNPVSDMTAGEIHAALSGQAPTPIRLTLSDGTTAAEVPRAGDGGDVAAAETLSATDASGGDGHQAGFSFEGTPTGDGADVGAAGSPSGQDTPAADGHQEGPSSESTSTGDGAEVSAGEAPSATDTSGAVDRPIGPSRDGAGAEAPRASGEPTSIPLIDLGMDCELRDGQIEVVGTAESGVAESMGLQDGDVITSINGNPVSDMTAGEIHAALSGQAPTPIRLTLSEGLSGHETTMRLTKGIEGLPRREDVSAPLPVDEKTLWRMAIKAAERLLKHSESALFPKLGEGGTSVYLADGLIVVEGYVDARNSLGQMMRQRFVWRVEYDPILESASVASIRFVD